MMPVFRRAGEVCNGYAHYG